MRQGTANRLPFVGWVSHSATESQAGLVLENDSNVGSVRLWGMEGLSSLMLRLSPGGLTSDSLAERCEKSKAARMVSIPHSHTSLHTYPLSKCFLSSYLEVTLQGPLSSSSSADPAPPCRALFGYVALPASPTKSPASDICWGHREEM